MFVSIITFVLSNHLNLTFFKFFNFFFMFLESFTVHENLWTLNFQSLLAFHDVHGHYNVPYHYYNPIPTGKKKIFDFASAFAFFHSILYISFNFFAWCVQQICLF
jgi:hypothetical protein